VLSNQWGAGAATTDAAHDDDLRTMIAGLLEAARARTLLLTDVVDDRDLVRQHSRLMSPLVWDLAHIGNQEELWLLRDVGGRDPILPETVDRLYDAFRHPRADRPELPLLDPGQSRRYVADVRGRVSALLERTPLHGRRLLDRGFVFGMILQHEQQHDETMLATQLVV
jgi:iron(II)-dependent oxidoreductase